MKRAFFPVLALLLASASHAGVEKVGTTSAAFLKLGSGSRPASLGEAYVALADDSSGIAYNPAGMSQMLAGEFQLTHTEWFRGLRYENLNGLFSLGDGGMIGLTFNFLSVPTITRTEQTANTPDPSLNYVEKGSFTPFDLQFAAAYSRPLYRNVLGGLNVKVLTQAIDDRSTFGLALDLGTMWTTPIKDLNVGFAFQNLGTPIKLKREAFDLPWLARLGASYRTYENRMLWLVEADMPSDNSFVGAFGFEYNFADKFFPRLGYRYNGIFNPWSVGMGYRISAAAIDISIVPFGELGMTYRATVSYRFGDPGADLGTKLPYLSSSVVGKPAVIEPEVSAPDKVTAWGLFIYDSGRPAKIVKSFKGSGPVPKQVMWDGKLESGAAGPEGQYWAIMSARYTTGKVVNTKYLRLEINNTPPQVDLSLDQGSVNPKAEGEAFVPTQFRPSLKGRAVARWRLELTDYTGKVFRTLRGDGNPPELLLWDGKGDLGDALISGTIYQARMTVIDPLGNEAANPTPVNFRAVFR